MLPLGVGFVPITVCKNHIIKDQVAVTFRSAAEDQAEQGAIAADGRSGKLGICHSQQAWLLLFVHPEEIGQIIARFPGIQCYQCRVIEQGQVKGVHVFTPAHLQCDFHGLPHAHLAGSGHHLHPCGCLGRPCNRRQDKAAKQPCQQDGME